MSKRVKRSLTEQLAEMEAFKDDILELVRRHFGRKPRKAAPAARRKSNGPVSPTIGGVAAEDY